MNRLVSPKVKLIAKDSSAIKQGENVSKNPNIKADARRGISDWEDCDGSRVSLRADNRFFNASLVETPLDRELTVNY